MMETVLTCAYVPNSVTSHLEVMEERLLAVADVARWLNMDEVTVQRMSREGRLPAVKIGREYRFRKADLEAWYDKQLKSGTDAR